MDEDDDDLYGESKQADESGATDSPAEVKDEKMDLSDEQEDDDDSDDDVQFTLQRPAGPSSGPSSSARPQSKDIARPISTEPSKPPKSSTPVKQESQRANSAAPPPTTAKGILTQDGREGKDFPEIRTSKVDVNGTPIWQANGKAITEVDIDADLAENSKLWRLPGTDQTDFFNYGFDEYTWAQYCVRQQTMGNMISEHKAADAQMKAMFGGGPAGAGAMPGMPGPPGGMPMPDADQMMQMVNQGIIPPEFAQQMMQMGGMPGMPGMGAQNSVSPGPQAGQGFQPPTGPSGGQQGGFGQGNMEGYSQQQMAMMQQDQQGPMQGGGGGRSRGRRGRGGHY